MVLSDDSQEGESFDAQGVACLALASGAEDVDDRTEDCVGMGGEAAFLGKDHVFQEAE